MSAGRTSSVVPRSLLDWSCVPFLLIAITINSGCGGADDTIRTGALVPVGGKVTFPDGRPLPGGYVVFRSRGTEVFAHGPIQKNGTYEMATSGSKGAPTGQHQVIVLSPQNDPFVPKALNVQTKDSINSKFANYETSGLEFEVTDDPSKRIFDIVVSK